VCYPCLEVCGGRGRLVISALVVVTDGTGRSHVVVTSSSSTPHGAVDDLVLALDEVGGEDEAKEEVDYGESAGGAHSTAVVAGVVGNNVLPNVDGDTGDLEGLSAVGELRKGASEVSAGRAVSISIGDALFLSSSLGPPDPRR